MHQNNTARGYPAHSRETAIGLNVVVRNLHRVNSHHKRSWSHSTGCTACTFGSSIVSPSAEIMYPKNWFEGKLS
ncbi:hypothetical protein NDU88_003452 [Pleurodeles waltl]|uniref:Uncharacterized protein n=1 Tax=Pleurodeles waltl TaxID=8319 RepID=A0AAV7Q9T9_PLEWA|nr:hypothetical protein NDU88_003452 [Pleurodeles waltl]